MRLARFLVCATTAALIVAAPLSATAAPLAIDPLYASSTPGTAFDLAARDPFGNVFIVVKDAAGSLVEKVDASGTLMNTYALDTGAQPSDIAIDVTGTVYISDAATGRIARIPAGGPIDTAFSTSPDGKARALAVVDATIWVLGATTSIYELDNVGAINPGFVFTAPATATAIAVNQNRRVFAATIDGRVAMRLPDGTQTTWFIDGSPRLSDIEARNDESWVVYADVREKVIERTVSDDINTTSLPYPVGDLALDALGSIYVVSTGGAVMTMPHGGYAPQQISAFSTAGVVSSLTIGPDQTLIAAWGATPLVAALPLIPSITSSPLNATTGQNEPFTATVTTGGGIDPVTIVSPNLPSWLSLTGGVLSGTPTVSGTYVFDLVSSNALGSSAAQPQTIVVNPAVAPTPTPAPTPSTSGSSSGAGGSGRQAVTSQDSASSRPTSLASTGSNTFPWATIALGAVASGASVFWFRGRRKSRKDA